MYKRLLPALFLLFTGFCHAQVGPRVAIGERTFRFQDRSRNRPVVTEVWYPTTDSVQASDRHFSPFVRQFTVRNGALPAQPLPLIMLSHGTGAGRLTLEWLAQALAQNGFIVAAVDHWGNTYDNKIPLEFLKPWERPLDISFALTELLRDPSFKGAIDPQRLGAAGFSYGGYTVLALAGGVLDYPALLRYYQTAGRRQLAPPELPSLASYLNDSTLRAAMQHVPPLKDPRLKAFFAIAPALGPGFVAKRQVAQVAKPVYIVGMQSDSLAPAAIGARHFHQLIASSQYFEFPGKTGHYVMLSEATDEVRKSDPVYFADDASVSWHWVHQQTASLATRFFHQHLP